MSTNTPEGRAELHAQYGAHAARARSSAAGEQLENVRRKHLTSAAAWEHLASVGRGIEDVRERRMLEKLAAVAAGKLPPEPGLDPIELWA